ncbi:MAG: GNAT family N-acetyltransferase [Planctomycetaceae bacterium]|nr:GNAT family N-acetyltransferase [Planctomycetaceae bacterium]
MYKPDIYFIPEYGKLFEHHDHGQWHKFEFDCAFGKVYYSFIVRPIMIDDQETKHFDCITPYGYGGPIITEWKPGHQYQLTQAYNHEFSNYCKKNDIITEFVRFHPLLNNVEYCKEIYDVAFNRRTVAIDLTLDDLMKDSFSQKCRNTIKKAIKNAVKVQFDFEGTTIKDFHRLYTLTMQKNAAPNYYFFTEEFFIETMRVLNGKIFILNALYNGEIVSSAMFMHHHDFMHYHFSATHPDYYKLACNNLIISEAARWGKDHGKRLFHLGGGFTTADDDPLLLFKKSFAKNGLREFWIGRHIHNHDIYRKLVELAQKNKDEPLRSDYFPLYRA